MANVDIRNVRKSYGALEVIHGVDMQVADGEFIVIVGPSGCGKSTLLRMVAGLEAITSGEIAIGDRVVNDLEPKDRDIAMVFQNYALYPHLTVGDNIGYPLRIRGQGRSERKAKVLEVARKVELEHLLERRPRDLSGGQRQRVALARAIVRRPQVFLMDEPLSNLDAKLRVEMRAEIKLLHQRLGATIVYVTHDQIEAMTLADRIVVMKGGVIQQVGTPAEVYGQPANLFVAGFVGSPPMNLMPAVAQEGLLRVAGQPVGAVPVPVAHGADLVLGIRPEDLVIVPPDEADLRGQVYMFELTGDAVLVTVDVGSSRICVRGDRHLRHGIGDAIGLRLDPQHCHFFDGQTQKRLQLG